MITDSLNQFNMFRWNLHIIKAYWNAMFTYLIIETAYLLIQVPTLHTVDSTPLFSDSTPLPILLFHFVLIPGVIMAFCRRSLPMSGNERFFLAFGVDEVHNDWQGRPQAAPPIIVNRSARI